MKRTISISLGALVVFFAFLAYSRTSVRAAGGFNLVVLCTSCASASGNIDNHGPIGTVVLDQNTGKVWHYPDDSIFG